MTGPSTLSGQLNYLWQFYLPPLPGMHDVAAGYPVWDLFVEGWIGRFGWLDYGVASWAYPLGGALLAVVAALAIAEIVRRWSSVRRRLGEAAVYLVLVGGLLVVLGYLGYGASLTNSGFEQARYLLPLMPLYAMALALAARAGGRRFGPAIGGAIVVVTIAWSVMAQLATVARYYG